MYKETWAMVKDIKTKIERKTKTMKLSTKPPLEQPHYNSMRYCPRQKLAEIKRETAS